MIVKVAPMGERIIEVNIESGTPIYSVLDTAGVVLNGRSIALNNAPATEDTVVNEGIDNIITLANQMKGGR